VRILLTGMSGTGKSTLVGELRRRGLTAYDADEDGFSEPRVDGRWGWHRARVAELLADPAELIFFAGCSEEQAELPFDVRVVLTAPAELISERLEARTGNAYGRSARERAQVFTDLAEIEPLLRRSADLVLETTVGPPALADALLAHLEGKTG
jgi:dephospho-CoA kinase